MYKLCVAASGEIIYTLRSAISLNDVQDTCLVKVGITVESSWNVMAHGDAGRGKWRETAEWSG